MSVAEHKAKGNAAFAAKDWDGAIQAYTAAIEAVQDPAADAAHILYSNRSAAYAGLRSYSKALEDAEECIKINPQFAKGYSRKGAALHGGGELEEAVDAYEEGLKIAPTDAGLKKGLQDVQNALENASGGGPGDSISKLFSDPQLISKLSQNPKTAPLLSDPAFVAKLRSVQQNPSDMANAFSDPRMLSVMGALMGIDLQAFERPEGSTEVPENLSEQKDNINAQARATPSFDEVPSSSSTSKAEPARASGSSTQASGSGAKKADEDAMEVEEESEETDDSKKAKEEADAEKAKGNALYLKRQFEPAVEHYKKAWELHKDITYLNNLGACYFEQGNLDECIKTCTEAVQEGRAMRADYKLVAKAFGRLGSAYQKKGDLPAAITNFEKSLTEHRTPEILAKLRDAEKTLKENDRLAYIDPAKAEEERNRGNDLYKEGNFAESVKAYTEAIKRNPDDPRGYTNRASAYTKLAALPEALKDAETAIKVDPKFVKAHIRKANVLFGMKEFTKALEAVQQGTDVNAEVNDAAAARELSSTSDKIMQALYQQRSGESNEETLARAMRDPEVAKIMGDPVMQNILQQAQSNPAALQDHMKNPTIRANIQKLIAAGVIQVGQRG
ncbi:Hsp90 cochaperone [Tilletia horrida]|uniref:Hsp90 cochaperone n=1 Tax=Tilletia horrida TaxID=155126 RepID=A0AAN6GN09_9BASI|nr:Hsp90 cochaperone [Tilletia horrida]KAK0563083.1 Hsp90 cochaperone [Tilletia horrida]